MRGSTGSRRTCASTRCHSGGAATGRRSRHRPAGALVGARKRAGTLEEVAAGPEPESELTAKETVEIAYMAAVRHLSPRQQTVLILREVLGHSARQTAELMDSTVASVNSAGQRARRTLRRHLSGQRLEWSPDAAPSKRERRLVERYLEATERGDAETVAKLLCEQDRIRVPAEVHRQTCEGRT